MEQYGQKKRLMDYMVQSLIKTNVNNKKIKNGFQKQATEPIKIISQSQGDFKQGNYLNLSLICAEAGWQKQAIALASRASDSPESCGFKACPK